MLLSLLKASGHSMEPQTKNDSFFMASSTPFLLGVPKVGDIIVFKNNNKIIVKKISKIEKGFYFIEGENPEDSKKFDPIILNEILGKVIWVL